MGTKKSTKLLTLLLSGMLAVPAVLASYSTVYAETTSAQELQQFLPEASGSIAYSFTGTSKDKAGYAEGTITLSAANAATYKLYWADDIKALDGFYPIEELSMKSGESKSVKMGYHTAIPAGATKVIAVTDSLYTADAYTVYDIPEYKRLSSASGNLLYKFTTFSDVHIDKGSLWYVNAETNFSQGLAYSVKNDSDYIIVSGDCVTNDSGPDKEWDAYNKVLSKSDFVNPVWESDGNHDMRQGVSSGLKSFMKGSGTDGSDSGKPYFYRVEENTGDIFIFMALELNKSPNQAEEFSDEQIAWVTKLLQENYQDGNIFLIQHSPIKGYGAGDRMSKPYYSGMLNQDHTSTQKFKKLLQDYPNIVFLSGHTHEDFVMDYNYFDDDGKAAHMIHTPSLAGSTMPDSSDTGLERNGGKGFHSQAYFTEVYQNEIVFYGVNILKELKYPKYSYIMEGSRTSASPIMLPEPPRPLKNVTANIQAELSKVSYVLSEYYLYASYDSYQALKNYYYQYKDKTTADESVIDEFEYRISALSKYTGEIGFYTLYDEYYFVNNSDWSNVYLYAWNSSSDSNAAWPGVKLSKTGTYDNKNLYKVSFSQTGEYKNIIFNSGSNAKQTVDISLHSCKYNGFKLNGTDSNGKYKVSNFKYDGSGGGGDDPEPENDRYALLYYVTDEHGWENIDTFLKAEGSVYKTSYSQTSENNFSFSLYDKKEGKYYSLAESLKITYENGLENEVTLEKLSSRGKSVTIYGMNKDAVVNIEYDPASKKLKFTCGTAVVPEELENTSAISGETIKIGTTVTVNASAKGGTGEYTYAVFYKKSTSSSWIQIQDFSTESTVNVKPAKAVGYDILVKAKDAGGNISEKTFSVNVYDALKNVSTVSSENIGFGDTVTVNAMAKGGIGEYTYAVYYKKSTSEKWSLLQKFSDNAAVTFKPSAAVSYDIMVKVQDGRGIIVKKTITVNVTKPENTSTLASEKISFGGTVDISCSASGGSGSYLYAVCYKKSTSDKWTIKQNFSANASVSFKPAAKVKYNVCVKAKDSLGNIAKKYFTVTVK